MNTATAQGADGVAHITYFDKPHALSFVWDGTKDVVTESPRGDRWTDERWIDVAFGGYAEPVAFRIPWIIDMGRATVVGSVADDILGSFTKTCVAFVNRIHEIESVDQQAHER
jgi:hypothetical protein